MLVVKFINFLTTISDLTLLTYMYTYIYVFENGEMIRSLKLFVAQLRQGSRKRTKKTKNRTT